MMWYQYATALLLCRLALVAEPTESNASPPPSKPTEDLHPTNMTGGQQADPLAHHIDRLAHQTDIFVNLTSRLADLVDALRVLPGKEERVRVQKPAACPPEWTRLLRRCFQIPPEKATWFRARERCRELHPAAQLASLHSNDESRLIQQLIQQRDALLRLDDVKQSWNIYQPGFHQVWIGLVKAGDDTWQWNDGTAVDFADWWKDQPDNDFGLDHCTEYFLARNYTASSKNGWNDLPCNEVIGFVCAIDLAESAT